MKYSQTNLDDIAFDAKLGRSLTEVANRLGISYQELLLDYNDIETKVKQYYLTGQLEGMVETDNQIYTLSRNGSVTAKAVYDKKQEEAKLSNIFRDILDA